MVVYKKWFVVRFSVWFTSIPYVKSNFESKKFKSGLLAQLFSVQQLDLSSD